MTSKVQTGLRIPEALYNRLKETEERSGVSINAQVLYLIDVGLRTINRGIQEERRAPSHKQEDTAE